MRRVFVSIAEENEDGTEVQEELFDLSETEIHMIRDLAMMCNLDVCCETEEEERAVESVERKFDWLIE